MKTKLIIAYLLNLFDLYRTTVLVEKYGIGIEANPIGRWLFINHHAFQVKVLGVGVAMLTLYYLITLKPEWEWTSWLILAIYYLLAIYHLIIVIIS